MIEIYACNVQGENCPTSIIKQLIEINKKNSSDLQNCEKDNLRNINKELTFYLLRQN